MKSLEERQKDWDNEHTGINAELNMHQYKYGRPARPSEKIDSFYEQAMQPVSGVKQKPSVQVAAENFQDNYSETKCNTFIAGAEWMQKVLIKIIDERIEKNSGEFDAGAKAELTKIKNMLEKENPQLS